ncbi:hypothetical protein BDZ89DRAFT_1043575 [Hymenopellis radicata]|nr:hypothetical protein BDZ89DRAFT_1043575 [Hymenopellis radicata]
MCCPFAGLTRPINADSKSSVGHVGADLKSSADSVVANLKSSNESQSQQQQARHRAEAKDTPHRLPDNRQSSGGDNRRSPGGRGGGYKTEKPPDQIAYASLRISGWIAGSGEIVAHGSFEPRKDGYSDSQLDSRLLASHGCLGEDYNNFISILCPDALDALDVLLDTVGIQHLPITFPHLVAGHRQDDPGYFRHSEQL